MRGMRPLFMYNHPVYTYHPRLEIECSRLHTDRNTSQKKMGLLAWFALLMSDGFGEVDFDFGYIYVHI